MAKKNLKKGIFITFEGAEGSGKSTQTKLLYNYLKAKRLPVVLVREPGTTVVGEKIRSILLDPKNKQMTNLSEMLLYMSARAEFVAHIVKPALEKGKIVISDRFLDSTLAYQGYGHGLSLIGIEKIGELVCQGIKPDLTILLDIASEKGLRRAGKGRDRIERRSLNYHHKVRRGYLALAKKNPKRIKVIRVKDNSIATNQAIIRKLVENKLCL